MLPLKTRIEVQQKVISRVSRNQDVYILWDKWYEVYGVMIDKQVIYMLSPELNLINTFNVPKPKVQPSEEMFRTILKNADFIGTENMLTDSGYIVSYKGELYKEFIDRDDVRHCVKVKHLKSCGYGDNWSKTLYCFGGTRDLLYLWDDVDAELDAVIAPAVIPQELEAE